MTNLVSSILNGVTQARFAADKISAEISKKYLEDTILNIFPVPRTEIKNITFDIKFAMVASKTNGFEVLITSNDLEKITENAISTLHLEVAIQNYTWTNTENKSEAVLIPL